GDRVSADPDARGTAGESPARELERAGASRLACRTGPVHAARNAPATNSDVTPQRGLARREPGSRDPRVPRARFLLGWFTSRSRRTRDPSRPRSPLGTH